MPKGIPAKKDTEKNNVHFRPPGEPTLPARFGAEGETFTLPEPEEKVAVTGYFTEPAPWTEDTFSAQVDRDELERLLGGGFEDVAGEPSRRSNQKFETYSDGVDCYCYQCPRGSKPPVVARTWAEVAQRMGV